MAAPTNYWDPRTACYHDILTIARVGPTYQQEDVVWHAWLSLLPIYFPPYEMNGRVYGIRREAYRGGLPPSNSLSQHKPDVVVIQMAPSPANPQGFSFPDPNVPDPARDILWVECKAPSEDTPGGWKDLMEQAGNRLHAAHPNRMLYVILAVGLKWVFFKWDPFTQGSPLQVRGHHPNVAWTMRTQYQYEPAVAGQSHVVTVNTAYGQTDMLDTTRAYSLDFFTRDPQYPQQPLHLFAMQLLERCLRHVQNTNFPGDNPTIFH
ncbi:hypothetical protein B0I37DRAFT_237267 [Chaetomium sp. MPI-CAGE-AT-0009]|nr:hypothetical protein B0I37DRAFT_237267 [Chaetomium sp. MPI-CAGE-AT-0009]